VLGTILVFRIAVSAPCTGIAADVAVLLAGLLSGVWATVASSVTLLKAAGRTSS